MNMSSTGIIICDAVSQVHLHNWSLQSVKMSVYWDVARKLQMGGRRGSHTLSHLRYLLDCCFNILPAVWHVFEWAVSNAYSVYSGICTFSTSELYHVLVHDKNILSYKEVMDTLGPSLSSTPVSSLAMHWWFSRRWKQMIQLFFGWRSSWCYTDADP